MKNKLTFLGHASMKIVTKDGVVIYLDPAFAPGNYSEAADIILVSHHHGDHDNVALVNKKSDCLILDNAVMLQNGNYQTTVIKGVKITAVPAYNKNHKKEESVGFLLSWADIKFYFGGDTSETQEMVTFADLGIDYAILPIDGVYNMNPEQADHCNELIKPRIFIPIHNDPRSMKDGKEYDTNFDLLKSTNIVRLAHGQTIDL